MSLESGSTAGEAGAALRADPLARPPSPLNAWTSGGAVSVDLDPL